ncbi:MAG: DUF4157 domain-containing protein, partial [bacterium]|nr:DUF4157 domain-containing protein [bacterium]
MRRCPRTIRRRSANQARPSGGLHRRDSSSHAPAVGQVLGESGEPLSSNVQAFMEPRFDFDFSKVRVHSNATAAESARAVNAHAYTVGPNIVFGSGQYSPETIQGRRLLAHELTHVVQQSGPGGGMAHPQRQAAGRDAEEEEAPQLTEEDREKNSTPAAGGAESSTDETL